ncbi:MAG: hypothetical protein KatS3mg004_3474 [Bryobacteraceae bacterium]|nr:MAG: hypothetical protein KatS3mg004_3474 [Bryobacteraceae bacterium]
MQQRFLDPQILAGIANLELTAKTVVEGFISGLHRSPDFGFSQEFAEYRPYTPGDDLRYVDWNVYARTGRLYLKRFRGETNTRLTILLDRSASMGFRGRGVRKIDYARFLAASLGYLAHHQRDAVGLIAFDDEVRDYVQPSSRHGQWLKVLHAIDRAEPGHRTDYARPFWHFQQYLKRRGIVLVISDFFAPARSIVQTIAPLRHRGNDVVLMHVLDPEEVAPELESSRVLIDMETGEEMEVSPAYAAGPYREKIRRHLEELASLAQGAGLDYHRALTSEPLDEALRRYLAVREGRP